MKKNSKKYKLHMVMRRRILTKYLKLLSKNIIKLWNKSNKNINKKITKKRFKRNKTKLLNKIKIEINLNN